MNSLLPELIKLISINTDDCVEWPFTKFIHFGYGLISYRGKRSKAHRIAWLISGHKLSKGQCVLHKCDNPPCINLRHLFAGTKADNNRDRHKKGRSRGLPFLYK